MLQTACRLCREEYCKSIVSRVVGWCAGPRTPWSADWVTSFFGSGAKSSAGRRAGSISPTRLFEFNGDNTVPEPEDLFSCWHGKLNGLGSPSRT